MRQNVDKGINLPAKTDQNDPEHRFKILNYHLRTPKLITTQDRVPPNFE